MGVYLISKIAKTFGCGEEVCDNFLIDNLSTCIMRTFRNMTEIMGNFRIYTVPNLAQRMKLKT